MRAQLSIGPKVLCWEDLRAEPGTSNLFASWHQHQDNIDVHKNLLISKAHLVTYVPLLDFYGFCSMFILNWIHLYVLNTADNQIIQISVYWTQYTFYYYSW